MDPALGVQRVRDDQAPGPEEGVRRGRPAAHHRLQGVPPENYPQLTKWFKDFKLSEKQLAGLENQIQKLGTGHEEDAVKAWMEKNPGIADKMAPPQ
ncbi:hypothetical protein GTV15_22100 [Streptomyces sp. SID7803]|nr:hypothetical protein [Streptomyces sp. SID7803]